MPHRKKDPTLNPALEKKLAEVEKLFRDLENDKNLPTFGEHFMQCLMFGDAERVNLKTMYPEAYNKLSKFLAEHDKKIIG